MEIRKTKIEEIDRVMEIILHAKEAMKAMHIPQWQSPDYPKKEDIEEDIKQGASYVVEDEGELVATMCLYYRNDPAIDHYDYIEEGKWLKEEGNYVVLHRCAVEDEYKGKGYSQRLFAFGEAYARSLGCNDYRIDTHEKNGPMLKAIEKYGFRPCGIVYMYDKTKRIAFQKLLA
ncbi:MAG: GNAT family N-acetyltransferase [Solobacterium sp.]|nr:GNAT family N-acetyltransferase [Solobacterium sp.]